MKMTYSQQIGTMTTQYAPPSESVHAINVKYTRSNLRALSTANELLRVDTSFSMLTQLDSNEEGMLRTLSIPNGRELIDK